MEAGDATLMVSHGGKIQRSSLTGRPTYVGGDNQLVKVRRSSTLRELHDRLASVAGCFKVALQYVLPGRPLDELHDVVTAADVQNLLAWVLLRDLLIQLYGANSEKVVPRVRVIVVSKDVRRPLPESLFTAKAPVVSSSSLQKRSASAPSLSACSTDDAVKPPSSSVIKRSASASMLTLPSTNPITTTTAAAAAASSTPASQEYSTIHYAAPSFPAIQSGPAPVFLVPVVPVIVYQPVIQVYQPMIPVYQGFLVPAGCPKRGCNK